jgi:hypothetical protein
VQTRRNGGMSVVSISRNRRVVISRAKRAFSRGPRVIGVGAWRRSDATRHDVFRTQMKSASALFEGARGISVSTIAAVIFHIRVVEAQFV